MSGTVQCAMQLSDKCELAIVEQALLLIQPEWADRIVHNATYVPYHAEESIANCDLVVRIGERAPVAFKREGGKWHLYIEFWTLRNSEYADSLRISNIEEAEHLITQQAALLEEKRAAKRNGHRQVISGTLEDDEIKVYTLIPDASAQQEEAIYNA